MVAVGSLVLESEQAFRQVVNFVRNVCPASQELIEGNIREVMRLRGPAGIVELVGLLWSATGFFTSLSYNINRAWPQATRRSAVQRRLVAPAMIAALVAAILWQIAAGVFAWYMGSGFARYEWGCGSLGGVSVLMLWIYLSSWIALGGAHLSAVISGNAN